jgi:hypothetical protein
MTNDPVRRTPEEIDDARHSKSKATVVLRAIADALTEIAATRDRISAREVKHLHDQLLTVCQLLDGHIIWSMEDEPATFADEAARDAYRDTYSDDTPVSIVVGPPSKRARSARGTVYDCGIPWLPNTTGNDGYNAYGRIPPGCQVMVVDPPHRRKPTARAAGRKGTWTSKR